jgi:hypothetical protein
LCHIANFMGIYQAFGRLFCAVVNKLKIVATP